MSLILLTAVAFLVFFLPDGTHGLAAPVLPLFVKEVISWLEKNDHIFTLENEKPTRSSFMIEVSMMKSTNHTRKKGLGLHLLPTPTCLDECRKPREILDMTNSNINAINNKNNNKSKIIHLHQDVWEAKQDIVKSRLLAQMGIMTTRLFARKTKAQRIPRTTAMQFLEEHHLWGATKAKHCYGLFHDQQLVAVATFSNKRNIVRLGRAFRSHELLRYCSRRDIMIVGGISKITKFFIRDRAADDIVTVVDRDWGDGSGWHSVGFHTVTTMDPIVMAVHPEECGIRRHLVGAGIGTAPGRLGLPQQILTELDQVDTADQAREILSRNSFYLVYDAGVQRLFRIVDSDAYQIARATATDTDFWIGSQPKFAETYYSPNRGILALLREAAANKKNSSDF